MRVLIGTSPLAGHINPLTSLARALLAAGHEVLWYTGYSFEAKISALGATFLPYQQAVEVDMEDIEARFPERAQYKGLKLLSFDLRITFLGNLEGQAADLLAIYHTHRPDVFLCDFGFMGAVAAKYWLQLPVVTCNISALALSSPNTAPFGFGLPPSNSFVGQLRNRFLYWLFQTVVMADLQREFNARLIAMGLPALDCFFFDAAVHIPDLVLQLTTPLFEYPRPNLPDTLHFIGPILPVFPLSYDEPDWWPDLETERPVVLVTQGTLATDPQQLILPAIRALANQDMLVVVTTANRPLSELGQLPANVRAESFIPYDRLLPHVNLLITNGGYGTVQMALAHGVPIVAAGKTEEKVEICTRIAWAGVGIGLKTNSPRAEQIQRAVLQIRDTPTYRQNAQRLGNDFARYDAPQRAVALIEQLIADRQVSDARDMQTEYSPIFK